MKIVQSVSDLLSGERPSLGGPAPRAGFRSFALHELLYGPMGHSAVALELESNSFAITNGVLGGRHGVFPSDFAHVCPDVVVQSVARNTDTYTRFDKVCQVLFRNTKAWVDLPSLSYTSDYAGRVCFAS